MKPNSILFEVAWEVCNQIGGIFTFIKSKIPTMLDNYGENYFLVGPYFPDKARHVFRPVPISGDRPLSRTIARLSDLGFDIHHGQWLLDDSRPMVILINPKISREKLNEIKTRLWLNHQISTIISDEMTDLAIGFGEAVRLFMTFFVSHTGLNSDVLAHFHEWMSATSIPELAAERIRITTIFTAHATVLGRNLAANEENYFSNLRKFDWLQKSQEYGIESKAAIERAAAQSAHVLLTNSEQTAQECEVFLGRVPDSIVPNGINKKPGTGHETFPEHQQSRLKIDNFVKSLFAPSYTIKAEQTLYFFTSGRFEYKNKGFNITLEAAARLNERLMNENSSLTIVFFVISKQPFHHIRPDVLESKKRFQDLNKICKEISAKIGPRIYSSATGVAGSKMPDLNTLVDEELLLTWKQAIMHFKRAGLPPVTTHQLISEDEITQFCATAGLDNKAENRVKIIYHPDFIDRTKSLFNLDYKEFIRGCHLGIFPSVYEPWGNTAMETALQGTPAISTDTSGFGRFVAASLPDHERHEIRILERKNRLDEDVVNQLTNTLYKFTETFSREQFVPRTSLPKKFMDSICWTELHKRYQENYKLAMQRCQPAANLY